MTKRKSNNQSRPADKTKFIMKAKYSYCQKSSLTLDFKPNRKHQLYKEYKDLALYPTFNNDRKYFTPTFVLKFLDNLQPDQDLKKLHQKKLEQYTTQIDSDNIYFPKPRSKNKYCGICKDNYQDYYNHIHSQQHRQHARTSRYTKYINQLSIKFNPHLQKDQKSNIQRELKELDDRYRNQQIAYSQNASSYQTCSTKSKKERSSNLKKQCSVTHSNNNNNKTTIILSSD